MDMAKEIQTKIDIQASPEKIWRVLTNFTDYPTWNPFIKSISGSPEKGTHLHVTIHPPGGSKMSFKPEVMNVVANSTLTWKGKLLISGIFDGEHHFELIPQHNGTTTFLHAERFKGLLVSMVNLEITKQGFEMMNDALKRYCEGN
jgi:hypothetical protein